MGETAVGPNYAPSQPEKANHIGQAIVPATVTETVVVAVPDGHAETGARAELAVVTPTQVRRPWRSTVRTVFQALLGLCVLFPVLVDQTGLTVEDVPWLAVPLAVAATVARIMALPQVEVFLRRFLPFLSATPKES